MPCIHVPSDLDALSRLPALQQPTDPRLPVWAAALATDLPCTAASMLELDFRFRSVPADQLGIYALARLAASQVHPCEYGIAYAREDLRRSGAEEIVVLAQNGALSGLEQSVYQFARQMTVAGREATDDQVAALEKALGTDILVGLVLNIGYANFQNRLVMALGLDVEPGGPLPPVEWRFADSLPDGSNTPSAARVDVAASNETQIVAVPFDDGLMFGDLQEKLERQRDRSSRIAVPTWDEIKLRLPAGLYPKPLRIRWSRLVVGYQPVIGPVWIKCLRVFEQEAHQDRVFEESVFWVVTRGLQCYYCMGHCEMLMEYGGLDSTQIAGRIAVLSSGDWSSFGIAEQAAFRFTHKLSVSPKEVSCGDFQNLVSALGYQRAIDCVWWSSRCHFMTKVSDAFQLPLERENVFLD